MLSLIPLFRVHLFYCFPVDIFRGYGPYCFCLTVITAVENLYILETLPSVITALTSKEMFPNTEDRGGILPIQGNKVFIIIRNRKMFCDNPDCSHTTFAERFDFISYKAKKTRRLEDEIVRLSINCSSVAASKALKENVVDIGKSTVCNLLKKRNTGC